MGCVNFDKIEDLARERAKEMFSCSYANVQPHSGASANSAIFLALLKPGDRVMGMRLDHGGHLSHGSKVNFSGKYFDVHFYGVEPQSALIDMDKVRELAIESQPKLIVCGASAYSRKIDFAGFRKIADEVGALLLADVAHYAGLIVGGQYPSPVGYADIVSTTTHKTLRGPRGGLVVTNDEKLAKKIDKAVFPGMQGGPLMHQVAAKAVAFKEALSDEFRQYATAVVDNARVLGEELQNLGFDILTGGTDSHLLVIDLRSSGVTGKEAEDALGQVGITVNKNTVPDDPNPPAVTSGIRVGTAALSSRGFGTEQMKQVANLISSAINNRDNSSNLSEIREQVRSLCGDFPLYPWMPGR